MFGKVKAKIGAMVMEKQFGEKQFGTPMFVEHIYYDGDEVRCTFDPEGKQFAKIIKISSLVQCTREEIDTIGHSKLKIGAMVMEKQFGEKPFGTLMFVVDKINYDTDKVQCAFDRDGKQPAGIIEITSLVQCTLHEIDTTSW